jgi:AraC-like DNA-binding protein
VSQARGVDRFLRDCEHFGQGYYREYAPAPDLRDTVACLWISVVHQESAGGRTPIIPDGCSDIMTYDAEAPRVAGTDTRTRWGDLPSGLVITGLRLRPGAIRAVFRCPATSLVDSEALLSDILTAPAGFHDQLTSASTVRDRHRALEHLVRTSMNDVSSKDRSVLWACRLLAANPQAQISTVSRRLEWQARTIHRQFTDACGYGPKYFQRIMRVQAAVRAARYNPSLMSLAGIASTVGYADQAHMNREFKAITGFTPANYFSLSVPDVGMWIGEDWAR